MLFRVWESINSWSYDERMLGFLSKLAEMHVDPTVSDPKRIDEVPYDSGDPPPHVRWERRDPDGPWQGLYKSVGIFGDDEWSIIMCKCLASMGGYALYRGFSLLTRSVIYLEIPLADAGSLTTGSSVDGQAAFEISRLPQCTWRICELAVVHFYGTKTNLILIVSLARVIVYSMMPDGTPAPASGAPTPAMTPFSSGIATPYGAPTNVKVADYLSAGLGSKLGRVKEKKYIGGSKALDALSKLIISVESFFHPTNSGKWTNDLTAFVKYLVYEFNKRWQEEQKPDCKTPKVCLGCPCYNVPF
jgi:proteasome activator subunit 4